MLRYGLVEMADFGAAHCLERDEVVLTVMQNWGKPVRTGFRSKVRQQSLT